MISGLIKNFVANFNYANNQLRRGGCFMFSNTTLTTMLESISQDLRDALMALSHREDISQKEMGDEFCRLVRKSFDRSIQAHIEQGKPCHTRQHPLINMQDIDGNAYQNVWVKPAKSGKFENELLGALNAVSADIADKLLKGVNGGDALPAFTEQVNHLKASISGYQQPDQCQVRRM